MFNCTLMLLCLVATLSLVRCDDNIFVTIEELLAPGSNTSVVGPPGPVGLVGLPGPRGTTGRIRTCQCDVERVERQRGMVNKFKATLHDYSAMRTIFNFKQNPDKCSVGIKTGRLRDSAMTASSVADDRSGPYRARLDSLVYNRTDRGSWLPEQPMKGENWLQVDLNQPTKITGIITQGHQYHDVWVSSFKIAYSNQTNEISFVKEDGQDKIFTGNHDRTTYQVNLFPEPIPARYFRLYVLTYKTSVAIRIELLTC